MPRKRDVGTRLETRDRRLRLPDGTEMVLPMRRHEEASEPGKRPKVWYTTDFSGLDSTCPRCGGWYQRDSGELGGSSGILAIGLRRRMNERREWVAIKDGAPWARVAVACSCVYGAWRNQVQRLPFADDFQGVPQGLSAAEWGELSQAAVPARKGDPWLDYEGAAKRASMALRFRGAPALQESDLPF